MRLFFLLLLSLVLPGGAALHAACAFIENGRLLGEIAVAADAPAHEQNAARELCAFIGQAIGGAVRPVADPAPRAWTPRLLVGAAAARQVLGDGAPDFAAMQPDEIYLGRFGDDLVIAGGAPRGTLYAVYELLEREFGVRFYALDCTVVPKTTDWALPEGEYRFRPDFFRRECNHRDVVGAAGEANWRFAVRRRLNGYFQDIPAEWGGTDKMLGFCHTFCQLLPESRYFADHPDWYSLIDGKRTAGHLLGQLCLTNPEMRAEFIRNARAWLAPEWPRRRFIAISINDNEHYCRCPECSASDARLGNPTDTLLAFINQVAEEFDREFPGVKIETLAYLYATRLPETVRPRDNVYIRLCSLNADFSRPLNSDANADFRDQVRDWGKIAPGRLGIWHYVIDFGSPQTVHPNLTLLGEDWRYCRDQGAVMGYAEGDAQLCFMRELRLWLNASLLWRPDADAAALTDEFLQAYYGAAAPHLAEFLALIERERIAGQSKVAWSNPDATAWFSPAAVAAAERLFIAAEAAVANDAPRFDRVRRARVAADWACLEWRVRDGTRPELADCPDSAALIAALRATMEREVPKDARTGLERSISRFARQLLDRAEDDALIGELVRGREYFDFQDFFYYEERRYGRELADPAASGGFAARLEAGAGTWAGEVSMWKPEVRNRRSVAGSWNLYAVVRADAPLPPDATLLTIGAYRPSSGAFPLTRRIRADEVSPTHYSVIPLGTAELTDDMLLYLEAGAGPAWLDRIILVRP